MLSGLGSLWAVWLGGILCRWGTGHTPNEALRGAQDSEVRHHVYVTQRWYPKHEPHGYQFGFWNGESWEFNQFLFFMQYMLIDFKFIGEFVLFVDSYYIYIGFPMWNLSTSQNDPFNLRTAIYTILNGNHENGWVCHFGLKCSTWTTINIGTSGRSACSSIGNIQYESVREGNCMGSRILGFTALV